MKLLLTGFEPFGGSRVNPSQALVEKLAAEGMAGLELQTAILAVDWERGPAGLIAAVERGQPDMIICLGEATGRSQITVERLFVNLLDFAIADNGGQRLEDRPIIAGGPAAYFATLPVRKLVEVMRGVGVPAGLSDTAGTFLCNQVSYTLLHYLSQRGRVVPAGFIHLPALPEQIQTNLPSMSLDTTHKALRAAIHYLSHNSHVPPIIR